METLIGYMDDEWRCPLCDYDLIGLPPLVNLPHGTVRCNNCFTLLATIETCPNCEAQGCEDCDFKGVQYHQVDNHAD